jgi:GNAT superfamily N-acetyltransferase
MKQSTNDLLMIAEAREADLPELLSLYRQLHAADPTPGGETLQSLWAEILSDPSYHILLAKTEDKAVASVTLIVIKNLTHGARPYAIIENVITSAAHRRQGFAAALMAEAVRIAQAAGCYKVSLATGRKDEGTLLFYEKCGFNSKDKTAFVRWL